MFLRRGNVESSVRLMDALTSQSKEEFAIVMVPSGRLAAMKNVQMLL